MPESCFQCVRTSAKYFLSRQGQDIGQKDSLHHNRWKRRHKNVFALKERANGNRELIKRFYSIFYFFNDQQILCQL